MSMKWVTCETVVDVYGIESAKLQEFIIRGHVRTQKKGTVCMVLLEDIERMLSRVVELAMVRDEGLWLTYNELWRDYGIRRGWLDDRVRAKKVRVSFCLPDSRIPDSTVSYAAHYAVCDVARELRDNPEQRLRATVRRG